MAHQHSQLNDRIRSNSYRLLPKLVSGMLLAIVTGLLPFPEIAPRLAAQAQDYEDNITLEELADTPEQYLRQLVTVRGNIVEDEVQNSVFRLTDNDFLDTDAVLVINPTGVVPDVPQDVQVQVTGRVLNYVGDQVAYALGYGSADEFYGSYGDVYADYEDRPVLIAQSVTLSPTPTKILAEPALYDGMTVAVEGEIAERLSPNVFTVAEEGLFTEDVLVINIAPVLPPEDAEEVVVTGEISILDIATVEQEYGFDWGTELLEQLEAEYVNRPVIFADGIYPSAN
ncbi:MAG: hypothetical protein Kow00121_27110 [Elainellaceae cyanobacterium]